MPKEIEAYIFSLENGELPINKERKQFAELVRTAFQEEDLFVDYDRIDKYLALQKWFPFELLPWEKALLVAHLCVFYGKNKLPRWPELFVLCGRGGGKNGFLAFLAFCLISPANDIQYYHIDICATNEDQARTSFDDVYNVLEAPKNKKVLKKFFRWTKEEIECLKTGSKLKFRTNNAKGKDGLRSGAVLFDEVHAYENYENLNVYTTGLGKKEHPRKTYVTTNGDVRDGVLDKMIEKAERILSGAVPDMGFLPFICKLDTMDEVDDEWNWHKANPSLYAFPNLLDQIRREYVDYVNEPHVNCAFMTKRMNIPKQSVDAAVTSWENIAKTNRPVPDLTNCPCVCGIDFAKTTDFVSAFLLFKKQETYYGIHHSWFCDQSNDKHRIKIPLDEMESRGILTIVHDVEVHPSIVADWVYEQKKKYNLYTIAIDSYRYTLMSRELREVGFDAKEKDVVLVRPSDIMRIQPKINSLFVNGGIVWGDDPLMRWFTNNTKLEPAPNNNFKYGKIEEKSRKTDGFMAFVAAMTIEEKLPEDHGEGSSFMNALVF
jgi:phage terminase large subunit-like protein